MISGLDYHADYLEKDRQMLLLNHIDHQPWITDMKRRVQHYGYRYDYRARRVDPAMFLGELPEWLSQLGEQLHYDGIFSQSPDQLIVNEYLPGQGIAAHVDCEPCFGDVIASLTLGSSCVMQFSQLEGDGNETCVLEPGSLLRMSGTARYQWQHAIPARKSDVIRGQRIQRQRRVSITFRTVVL